MPCGKRQLRWGPALLVTLACASVSTFATVAAKLVLGQPNPQRQGLVTPLSAADLATLVTRCGGAEPLDESLEPVRNHACSGGRFGAGEILAFEENRWFVYALADISHGPSAENGSQQQQTTQRLRRVFLLKPSTLVVEDVVRSVSPELSVRWMLRCATEPKIEAGWFRVTAAHNEILGQTELPDDASLSKIT